jgi:RNA polymerase sigma factor for flagellar operon FliA
MSCVELRSAEREARGLRDRLVANYSPLVRYVAGRTAGRLAGPLDQEDLISSGLVGLLGAVETFDPGRRTKFESYAISKIRWSILDELRKIDPLSRRTRLRAHQIDRARDELVQKLGRAPTESELVGRLGISVTEHRTFLDQYARAHVRSFEAVGELQGGPVGGLHDLIGDHAATDPASAAEVAEVRARLVRAIGCLGEKEQVVTTFYYFEGLTLREIGRVLDLTEGRISQILHAALARLRHSLDEEGTVPRHAAK